MVLLRLERKIFLSFVSFFKRISTQKCRSYFTFFFYSFVFRFSECTTQINCIPLEPLVGADAEVPTVTTLSKTNRSNKTKKNNRRREKDD